MDSLTQIALGSAVTALIAPARHRRAALVAGGVLGTLPDLDVIPITLSGADAVSRITWHRGPSHSLLVLAVAGWLFWLVLRRCVGAREGRAISMAVGNRIGLAHSSVAGCVYRLRHAAILALARVSGDGSQHIYHRSGLYRAAARRLRSRLVVERAKAANWWLLAGVLLSTAYLGWSLTAKAIVERAAQRTLVVEGLQDAPRFSVPMPFNTVLWRVVVMTPDGFLEGERSLVADRGPTSSDAIRATVARWRPWPDFLRCGGSTGSHTAS